MRVAGDLHTHVWSPEHMSAEFRSDLARAWGSELGVDGGYDAHAEHAVAADRVVVLAFDAEYAGFVVPDEFVAAYVRRDPARLVGFCSIDPRRADARDRLARAVEELGLRGVKLAPTYQGFDPLSPEAYRFYELVAERDLPIVWHQGTTFVRKAILEYALPRQIDNVAIRFPELRIAIAHLGHPWIEECIVVVRKHPNVYSDISALTSRPSQFEHGLRVATEYRCGDKLLFGTDWPFDTIGRTVDHLEALERREDVSEGLRATVRSILTRDPLAALGL
jgi:predicted TIM-barrel fold metal-dependent hydrolase